MCTEVHRLLGNGIYDHFMFKEFLRGVNYWIWQNDSTSKMAARTSIIQLMETVFCFSFFIDNS